MRIFAAILFCLFLSPVALADDAADHAARKDVAAQIIALSTGDAMVEQMTSATWPPYEALIRKQNPDITDEVLVELKAFMHDEQAEAVSDIIQPIISFYAEEFTLDELNTILGFYQSETGTKLLSISPKIVQQLMPQIMLRQQQMMPKLIEIFKKAAKEKGVVL